MQAEAQPLLAVAAQWELRIRRHLSMGERWAWLLISSCLPASFLLCRRLCGEVLLPPPLQGFANGLCRYAAEYANSAPEWEVAAALDQLCSSDEGIVKSRLHDAELELGTTTFRRRASASMSERRTLR